MPVRGPRKSTFLLISMACLCLLGETSIAFGPGPVPREDLRVAGADAFVLLPPESTRRKGPMPWVWYAPTLRGLPGKHETWMFERFHAAGIAVAGVNVGESYGSPAGRTVYQKLYEELTTNRGFAEKPVLFARSRGGLMLYNWAVEHPNSVAGIAGIYPVCNLTSYPGLSKAAPAYEMTPEELGEMLDEHNPVDRLEPLAKAKVPIHHIHGDSDRVVPLELNSALLVTRYRALGGPVEIEVVEGRGHNLWNGWFQSERLTKFVIERALGERPASKPAKDADRGSRTTE